MGLNMPDCFGKYTDTYYCHWCCDDAIGCKEESNELVQSEQNTDA